MSQLNLVKSSYPCPHYFSSTSSAHLEFSPVPRVSQSLFPSFSYWIPPPGTYELLLYLHVYSHERVSIFSPLHELKKKPSRGLDSSEIAGSINGRHQGQHRSSAYLYLGRRWRLWDDALESEEPLRDKTFQEAVAVYSPING